LQFAIFLFIPGDQNNFLIYNDQITSEFSEEYDFGSVMHHGQFSFARNPDVWTIKPKDEYNEFEEIMGQRRTLSVMDAKKVNTIYKCSVPAGRRSGSLTTRAKTIQQVVKKTSRIQVTQAPTTTEEPTTVDTTDEAQPYEPETTTPTTTTTRKPKPPTSTRRKTKPVVITEAPDEDTDERKVKTASSSIVHKVGEEGERNFWWTGLPPDFYKPPQDAQEFYPWKTNGVMIFNGEKRIVTSGFRTGLHPNGSHWRTNWFKWQYPEEFFATTLPPSDELQMDDMASDRDSSKLDLMQSDEADKLISGRKGSLTFQWTGPPPDFYKRPRNKHEFYPWLTNGVITFRGQQRRVSSGFDSGIYANGTKWRRNWYEWSYVEG
jgi:Astacin (Peptidase family M12A)